MDNSFPALECLALHFTMARNSWKFNLSSTFLQGSAQRLRHLNLGGIPLSSLSQLLSSTTGLIDLRLCTDGSFCSSPAASLLAHLQAMPFLRRLELEVRYPDYDYHIARPAPSMKTEDITPLSKLTSFLFLGLKVHLEELLVGLAAPSLQDFRIVLHDYSSSPILHLPRFIHDEGRPVFAAKFVFTARDLDSFLLHSIDDPPFRMTVSGTGISMARISAALSATLATVEDPLLSRSEPRYGTWLLPQAKLEGLVQCHEALASGQFRNVEILRLRHALVLDVAEFLRRGDGEHASDILPALKEIELHAGGHCYFVSKSQRASVLGRFGPFVAVRQRMGRPVNVFWNTDQVVPKYFMYANDRVPSKSPLWFDSFEAGT
ncbi:hypothetical protein BJV78DRAFT_474406 [Lactifluus subvellereus]|nr:hypothetical protein BJV78DRAFT_474406 [Lactifluus subvellereus]